MAERATHRRALALAVVILAAAGAVRVARLDSFSYGLDEILQTYWMPGTWDYFWESLRFDAVHPPLSYLVARGMELLAASDAARKLPGVLFGIAGVGVFAALIARRAGSRAGLIAGALLAFAPFHVRYSQELRPYPLRRGTGSPLDPRAFSTPPSSPPASCSASARRACAFSPSGGSAASS